MSKKKVTTTEGGKAGRAKAAAAANPVRPDDASDQTGRNKARAVAQPPKAPNAGSAGAPVRLPFRRPQTLNFAGVGRNDICPCGSGKRFKNCHGH